MAHWTECDCKELKEKIIELENKYSLLLEWHNETTAILLERLYDLKHTQTEKSVDKEKIPDAS